MSSKHWQQIEPLLNEALNLPPDQRDAFLQQACNGDQSLRQEIESLLEEDERLNSFLETPVLSLPDEIKQLATDDETESSLTTQPFIGQQLGKYKIISLLGKGGMGEVYLAHDPELDRKVAIKLLPPSIAHDPEQIARFKREARMVARLNNHPNIAIIHDLELNDTTPFLVLEYVPGPTLAERLQGGRMPLAEALPIFQQIAAALVEAQKQGIIHRDLKPANIKIAPGERVKVLDFGLAKILHQEATAELAETSQQLQTTRSYWTTERHIISGTVPYMSPEQTYGLPLDQRTDIWAFGCILFEALTGQRPFQGTDTIDLFHAIRSIEPAWQRLPENIPPAIRNLLQQCLQKDSQQRLITANDAQLTLSQAIGETPSPDFLRQLKRRKKVLGLVAMALIVLALGFVFRAQIRHGLGSLTQVKSLPTEPLALEKTLVVLPFKEEGAAETQVGTGLAKSLQDLLSFIPELHVLPTARAAQINLADADPARLLKALGVNLLLAGEVKHEGDKVSIKYWVQNNQNRILSDSVEGNSSEYARMQTALVAKVASALKVSVIRPPSVVSFKEQASEEQYLTALNALQSDLTSEVIKPVIKTLNNLLQKEGDSARILAALSQAHFQLALLTNDSNAAEQAITFAGKAISADPQATESLLVSGQALYFLEKYDEAIQSFQKARQQQPSNIDAILGVARAYEDQGRLKEAEEQYNAAVTLWPIYWGGYNERGAFYFAQGQFERARKEWEQVINLNPDGPSGFVNVGNAYFKLGDYPKAEYYFRLALEKKATEKETTEDAYTGWGAAQLYQRQFEAAAKSFQAGLTINEKSPLLRTKLGDALRQIPGKEEEALGEYQKALAFLRQSQPGPLGLAQIAEIHAKRSKLLGDTGQPKIADTKNADYFIRLALKKEATDNEVLASAMLVYELIGNESQALTYAELALKHGYSLTEIEHTPELQPLTLNSRYATMIEPFKKAQNQAR